MKICIIDGKQCLVELGKWCPIDACTGQTKGDRSIMLMSTKWFFSVIEVVL